MKPTSDLQSFLDPIEQSPVLADLCRRLAEDGHAAATGQWGSCALVLAAIVQKKLNRPVLILTAHLDEADDAVDQLSFFHSGCDARLYPAFEVLPGESNISDELAAQRLELLVDLANDPVPTTQGSGLKTQASIPQFLVAPIQSLMQPSPGRDLLKDLVLIIRVNESSVATPSSAG